MHEVPPIFLQGTDTLNAIRLSANRVKSAISEIIEASKSATLLQGQGSVKNKYLLK